ncbi:uncharacterized protein PHACADRAFT_202265 [Phanerochaete carnosa HHB-10118-sp]|uniref:C2H2-type domain-containing protein n=1 Tax=Phanerochaete carnosa (strain HHB-10118-sp) TaxID=650164 RepID=K5UHD3_PHACS|nr:uncharacterized protein PHACADRAFT_202265 [Phanerochaete carnosa HHB-10118-sp]EKM48896.1 hypothetical protein PHACADRAFT_202265 [Phanerochaete carnosa HHB-10118-sp]
MHRSANTRVAQQQPRQPPPHTSKGTTAAQVEEGIIMQDIELGPRRVICVAPGSICRFYKARKRPRHKTKRPLHVAELSCEEEEPTYHWRDLDGERKAKLRQGGYGLSDFGVSVQDGALEEQHTAIMDAATDDNDSERSHTAVNAGMLSAEEDVKVSSCTFKTSFTLRLVPAIWDTGENSTTPSSDNDDDRRSDTTLGVDMLAIEGKSPRTPEETLSSEADPPNATRESSAWSDAPHIQDQDDVLHTPVQRSHRPPPAASTKPKPRAAPGRYPCLYRGCGRTYGLHKDRVRHMDTAHGAAGYGCLRCDKTFSRFDSLQRHRQNARLDCHGPLTVADKAAHAVGGADWLADVSGLVEPAQDDPIRESFRDAGRLREEDMARFGLGVVRG